MREHLNQAPETIKKMLNFELSQAIWGIKKAACDFTVCEIMLLESEGKKPNASKHRDGGPTKNLLPECEEASDKTC